MLKCTNIEYIPDACQNVLILNTFPRSTCTNIEYIPEGKCTNIEHIPDVKMY